MLDLISFLSYVVLFISIPHTTRYLHTSSDLHIHQSNKQVIMTVSVWLSRMEHACVLIPMITLVLYTHLSSASSASHTILMDEMALLAFTICMISTHVQQSNQR
jgi:uncharacterized membrane protein YobD (UPF0266 family)